jgi:hypothetical protein
MKELRKTLIALLAIATTLASCSNDECPENTHPNAINPEAETATLVVRLQSESTYASTRDTEAGSTEEDKIQKLAFLFFDENGNAVSSPASGNVTLTNGHVYTFTGEAEKQVQVLILANADNASDFNGKTLSEVEKLFVSAVLENTNSKSENTKMGTVPTNGFAMSAKVGTTKLSSSSKVEKTALLRRLSSKVNAPTNGTGGAVDASDKFTQAKTEDLFETGRTVDPTTITFNYQGYALINGVTKSIVWMDDKLNNWNVNKYSNLYQTSTFNGDGTYATTYSGHYDNDYFLLNDKVSQIYVYENVAPLIDPSDKDQGYVKNKTYALVIKGTLTTTENVTNPTVTRYWRANILGGYDYKIARNSVIKTGIAKITGPGYETPKEAEEGGKAPEGGGGAGDIEITVSVQPWEIVLDNELELE